MLADSQKIISSTDDLDNAITKADAVKILCNALMLNPNIDEFNFSNGTSDDIIEGTGVTMPVEEIEEDLGNGGTQVNGDGLSDNSGSEDELNKLDEEAEEAKNNSDKKDSDSDSDKKDTDSKKDTSSKNSSKNTSSNGSSSSSGGSNSSSGGSKNSGSSSSGSSNSGSGKNSSSNSGKNSSSSSSSSGKNTSSNDTKKDSDTKKDKDKNKNTDTNKDKDKDSSNIDPLTGLPTNESKTDEFEQDIPDDPESDEYLGEGWGQS